MMKEEHIVDFCSRIKMGMGSVIDFSVKSDFERLYEIQVTSHDLALLLCILEKHNLLDKSRCVNSQPGFYVFMYEKMRKDSRYIEKEKQKPS